MASHSPQRARRPPAAHPVTQGSMHNLRESSRSPSHIPRSMRTHSMPIVPSALQVFAASNHTQPSTQAQQQPSPTSSIGSRRSPPTGITVQRLLPTPPHPPIVQDSSQDPHVSPPLPPQHSHNHPDTYYPRPMHRAAPQFLNNNYNIDQENWEVTDELMAEIERAAMQQQSQSQSSVPPAYTASYQQNTQQTTSPPRDPAVERVRALERSSPKEPDINQQQQQRRQQQAARESPNNRERQPTSPTTSSFPQAPSQTPERRGSPYQTPMAPTGEHPPSGYIQYTHEPVRRATNAQPVDNRLPLGISLATQTPPLQSIPVRTPDRSLPVQEEPEDEPGAISKPAREVWSDNNDNQPVRHTSRSSPTPSSDLNPENGFTDGRASRAVLRDDGGPNDSNHRRNQDHERDQVEDEGYTPRSPTAELPENPPINYYSPPQNSNSRVVQSQVPRRHSRNGSTDQLGLPSFDPSVFAGDNQMLVMGSDQHSQYTDRRQIQTQGQGQTQTQTQTQHQSSQANQYLRNSQQMSQAQYLQQQMYLDDMQTYDSSYVNAYLQSPRPGAPVPPTPHSQTAAPSPSPLISGHYDGGGNELPPFSPIPPVGSPYPYPFNHVRRPQPYSNHPDRPRMPASFDPNELSKLHMETMKQWQAYARNNQRGPISDTSLSPSATPFRAPDFNSWAYLHTNKTLGPINDTISMRSSPSHEPVHLPVPPMVGVKKGNRPAVMQKRRSNRKPPPRVESTQPRETSPEPSSSGEETAGEEQHFVVAEEGSWVNGSVVPIAAAVAEENDEWMDEEDDNDDLLELEFHPNYVSNIEKRRRRWEIGWELVTQALQNLDRQTDATIVLMAAPSHSNKLYAATSRAVRRQSPTTRAVAMKEMRSAFSRISTQRRVMRSHKSSLLDRFLLPSSPSGDGSDGSSESREEDLRRALEAALGSLGALGGMYEQREARWHEEMGRMQEDRERVEILLRQVLGDNHSLATGNGVPSAQPIASS